MESLLFTREDLKKLIVPLIIEQALALSIGLFDTLMVSSCGEAATEKNRIFRPLPSMRSRRRKHAAGFALWGC